VTAGADWDRVKRLFHDALDLAPDARLAFVRQQAGDTPIVEEVMSLLRTYPASAGFLSTPPDPGSVSVAVARLGAGDEIGPFRIASLIGAGGMGEVYRAWDTRLEREVAIKILPQVSSIEPGRERFEAEARAISRLTHPRISTLYDAGSASIGGATVQYLVMELVDGETLAARLRRGPLPVSQALAIAVDVGEALAAAHAAGVIHRDVKPSNIMLTRSGAKLLDFGLARLRPTLATGRSSSVVPSDPPTHQSRLFGTLPYMAPELLRGAEADVRTDIFAFGAVLYEMLAGAPAFRADSEADLVAAILEHDPPPITDGHPLTPAPVVRLLATCLAREPQDRWQSAQDLVRALRWMREDGANSPATAAPPRGAWRQALALSALTGIVVLVLATALGTRPAANPSRISFPVLPPDGARFPRGTAEMAIAPDGSRLVFVALSSDGSRHLWMRRFDAVDSRQVEGTDGAYSPFWSPDGRWIGFFARSRLMKVAATGGEPQPLCEVRMIGAQGGSWSGNGTILFSTFGKPLQRIPDTGGIPRPATVLDESRQEVSHAFPAFLPDGRRFLYLSANRGADTAAVYQGALDSTEVRRLFGSQSNVNVAGGYLVSRNKGLLLAQTYDPDHAQVTGTAVTLAENITSDPLRRSGGAFSAAGSSVAYRSASPDSHLLWIDRSGKEIAAFQGDGDFHHPQLSPDERSVAIEKTDPATGRHTIWVLDLARGTASRLLLDPAGAHVPRWSADGSRIVFCSNRLGGGSLFVMPADGTADAELVLPRTESGDLVPADWSFDGRFILYRVASAASTDLWILPIGAKEPFAFQSSSAEEAQGRFSPDAKWISYTSNESGAPEVYVRPFPGTGPRRLVSITGGVQGLWRRDGKEFFYLAPDGRLMAVDITTSGSTFEAGAPHALFDTGIRGGFVDRTNQYAVTRDGQRFLVNRSVEDENSAPITVVLNWGSTRR
jgi:eukaryotic-like serine/threonine-protein kinase